MHVTEAGSQLWVRFDAPDDPRIEYLCDMLLGYVCNIKTGFIKAENNVVNRMVLNLNPLGYRYWDPECVNQKWYDTRLAEYQMKDCCKMIDLGDSLNLNLMGYGKTVETIYVMKAWGAQDIVIVAPKSVCPQWVAQLEVWWPETKGNIGLYKLNKPITVLNYEKLLNTATITQLKDHQHDVVVFDEIHKLKNRNAKRTKAAISIPAKWHMGLTGTPILKNPDDLWSILNVLDWHYSGKSYWNFIQYFCHIEEGFFGRKITGVTHDEAKLAILKKLLNIVSLRNESIQVAYGKQSVEVLLEMSPKQKVLYKKIKNLILDELPENCTIANGAVLSMRLQQTTSWPGLFEEGDAGAKFQWILDFCECTEEQVVVFTRFAKTAIALQEYLNKKGISCVKYTGKQPEIEKQKAKQMFIKENAQVFVATIGAAGEGFDGLQCARLGIMMERDWSPEINKQCEDRLHRRGQQNPVIWYYLTCDKSFDKHVGKVNLHRAEDIRKVLEED